jgi:hypothetical protein
MLMIKVQNMKKLIARTTLVVIGTFCLLSKSNAQVDPHFSQYYVYPAWVNPALTGIFDGSYRVSGIYRNQWGNVSSPFSTPRSKFRFCWK